MINKILRSLLIGMMLLSISDIFGGGDAKKKMQSPQAMTRIVDQSSAANFTQVSRNNLNNACGNSKNWELLSLKLMEKDLEKQYVEVYNLKKRISQIMKRSAFTVDQLREAIAKQNSYNAFNVQNVSESLKNLALMKKDLRRQYVKIHKKIRKLEKRRLPVVGDTLFIVDQFQEAISKKIPFNPLNIQIWNNPKEKAKMWDFLMGTFHKISMNVYKENGILKIKNFLDELQKFINWWFIENDALSYLDKESKDQLEQDEKNLRDFWKGVVQLFQRNNGMIVNEVIGDRDGKLDVENREIRLKEVQQLIEGLIHINGKNINDKTELETLKILINREIMMMQLQQTLQKRYGVGC